MERRTGRRSGEMHAKAPSSSNAKWLLAFILLVAAYFRMHGVGFGLPALYDPDEPVFVMTGLRLLRDHTLNPGWFGHPGTTTIYVSALLDLVAYGIGHLAGYFPDPKAFAEYIYSDPTIVFLPGRIFTALCGIFSVFLLFLIGKRLFSEQVGLLAAALLAINPLHIQYSQLIRTDVQASVFMLLCVLAAIRIVERGRLADYVLAGIWVGLACATKWPAVTIGVAPLGAGLLRIWQHPNEAGDQARRIPIFLIAAVASLLFCSPYLLLDYDTLLSNLRGEARPRHLGATSHGFLSNANWYLSRALPRAVGVAGALLVVIGMGVAALRSRVVLATIVPATIVFAVAICAQALFWARWLVPLLPFVSLFMAVALRAGGEWVKAPIGRYPAMVGMGAVFCVLAVPMMLASHVKAVERINDTRSLASAWARRHVPPGSRVVIEHVAMDLSSQPWTILFPAGSVGCVDAKRELQGRISYSNIDRWRGGRSIVDLGTIDRAKLDSCWADYAIISHYDRYRSDRTHFGEEAAVYERFLNSGVLLRTFRPEPGKIGGPVVHLVQLKARHP